jgi:hypothetical protein
MTQRKHDAAAPTQRPASPPTSARTERPAITDDSTTFSLAALAEAELRRSCPPCPDPSSSGIVVLEDLRGHRTRPTYQLVDPTKTDRAAKEHAIDRPWVQAGVIAMGMAASAVVGVFAFAVQNMTPTVAIEHKARPAATLALHHAEPTLATAEAVLRSNHRAQRVLEIPTREEVTAEAEANEDEAPPRATPAPARPRPAQATPARPRPAPTPAPAATPARPSTPTLSADCILDPSRCGPERLTSAQVRTGLQQVVPAAKLCAAAHGAATGTRVPVRLSIDGATGSVRSATPQAPHQDALGRCVANELGNASFPAFTQSSMGVVYTVTL